MIAAVGNYSATALASKISRNIKINADTFTDDEHYLKVATNFRNTLTATINDTLKVN